ncbi:hypothetical protein [Streptomyces goshikiensis]|uniref:hypothetical protein n=1 Tax=Streptomyces goshikiensis TaxID=1942 RepID=UPI0036941425
MTTDPAPHLLGPEDAFERLAEWQRRHELLMLQRDPLVVAALTGPLSAHGGVRQAERASGLTAQTLRRIKASEGVPILPRARFDEVDWDEYADYLETMGNSIRTALAELPAPEGGRDFTADDLRAVILADLAERLRSTELTDFAMWQLTIELRHEAQDQAAALPEKWVEPAATTATSAVRAQLLSEVADQISAFREMGPAAADRLHAGILARARGDLAPSGASSHPKES